MQTCSSAQSFDGAGKELRESFCMLLGPEKKKPFAFVPLLNALPVFACPYPRLPCRRTLYCSACEAKRKASNHGARAFVLSGSRRPPPAPPRGRCSCQRGRKISPCPQRAVAVRPPCMQVAVEHLLDLLAVVLVVVTGHGQCLLLVPQPGRARWERSLHQHAGLALVLLSPLLPVTTKLRSTLSMQQR